MGDLAARRQKQEYVAAQKSVAALLLSFFFAATPTLAATSWGGSIGVTSDYLVRGISRSNHSGALQSDLHIAFDNGVIGGVFASATQFATDDHRDVELSALVGFAWSGSSPWRAKILASHYSYPWSDAGSNYNYDEINVDASFREWLDFSVMYSPNSPRFLRHTGLIGVTEKSAEVNFRTPWRHRLAGTAGVGYSEVSGPAGTGYAYWSAGAVYDLAPWSFSLSYVNSSAAARYLFYNTAARDRWAATVIWQF
jgi:uncharacterized protein (TIGR02001 family)